MAGFLFAAATLLWRDHAKNESFLIGKKISLVFWVVVWFSNCDGRLLGFENVFFFY